MFLVPIDTSGVEVREIQTLRAHRTNMTYYADVRIPDLYRVGDVDDGWAVVYVVGACRASGTATRLTIGADT
jgi:alkylation response protein AidB-like acyl-CoA dehydrogenase